MHPKKIYEGAEAELFIILKDEQKLILKKRKSKNYREKLLDQKILKQRTRKETKMLQKIPTLGLLTPTLIETNIEDYSIIMTYLEFPSLKKSIEKDSKNIEYLGKDLAKLHNNNIIHGDITLENILFDNTTKRPAFIDFGLSFESTKLEDITTDLYVFKKTLLAEFPETLWQLFLEQYLKYSKHKNLLAYLGKIEKRRRNA